jgi:16S rRNA processing protein RimM
MSDQRPALDELISIARIARPQGIRGEVIADVLTDFPERFEKLRSAWVITPTDQVEQLNIERARLHKGRVLLKITGFDNMDQAEALRGFRIAITENELAPLPPDAYYDFDLKGCEVSTVSGECIGSVEAVEKHGAAPLLKVRGKSQEHLIPLVLSICVEIDVAHKRIVIAPPEGLLEL